MTKRCEYFPNGYDRCPNAAIRAIVPLTAGVQCSDPECLCCADRYPDREPIDWYDDPDYVSTPLGSPMWVCLDCFALAVPDWEHRRIEFEY